MKQAKVLTEQEFKRVLAVIASGRHAARNRVALMLSHHAGLRVGEIASLSFANVVKHDDARIVVKHVRSVRDQIRLNPSQTKGGVARTVFMNKL